MISIKNNTLKIIGALIFVLVVGIGLEYQRRGNVSAIQSFNAQSIESVVNAIYKGSAGFYSIKTIDGVIYTFCPKDSFFKSKVQPGDSIFKRAYADTLLIYNKNKRLAFAFLQ